MAIDDKNFNTDNNDDLEFNSNSESIEFDDNIDIDALQNQLQAHMSSSENIVYDIEKPMEQTKTNASVDNSTNIEEFSELLSKPENNENSNTGLVPATENTPLEPVSDGTVLPVGQQPQEKLKLQPGEKKFVVYIEPENIDFIESLSIKDRKKVINRVLHYEDKNVRLKKERREREKFTKQVLIMVITVVVSLPFFFMLLNKSIELTIINYQQAQQNFVKLYKEQGKIKSYKNFQKNFD